MALVALCAVVAAALLTGGLVHAFTPQSDAQEAAALLQAGLDAQGAGHTDAAVEDYRKVLAHDPRNAFAYYNMGVIEQRAGDVSQASLHYLAALDFKRDLVGALFNLAVIETSTNPGDALRLYRLAETASPSDASIHLNLGFLLLQLGQQPAAVQEFAAAVRLDPTLRGRLPSGISVP